jgi:hypothetical protein
VSNPYQAPPPDPYGGPYGGPPGQPYGAPVHGGPPVGYGPAPTPGYGYLPPQPAAYGIGTGQTGEPNSMATASAVLGFFSIMVCFYGGLIGPLSLGLGIAGVNRSRRTGTGRSTAIGGIIMSGLGMAISIAAIVFFQVVDKKTT